MSRCITWLKCQAKTLVGSIFFLMLAATSHAEAPLPKVKIAAGEWPPFLSATLPDQGVVAHLIKDVFREAGYDAEFEFLPWVRAFVEASEGNYDATAVWMFKEDRTAEFHYSAPVLNEEFVLFYRRDEAFDWSTYADLQGKLIGGGIGYSYGREFDTAVEEGSFKLLRLETVEQNLRMLAANRTDLYVEEKSIAYFYLQNTVPELAKKITHHPQSVLINQSFLLFPKSKQQSETLMDAFNTAIERFKSSGEYASYFAVE